MSTAFFSVQNAACVRSGIWSAFGSPTSFAGHSLMHSLAHNSALDIVVTGTELKVNTYGLAHAIIDGGSPVAIGDNSGSVVTSTVFTGLTDTAHTVNIYDDGGDFFIDQTNTGAGFASFEVTGSSPAVSSPSGFGTQTPINSVTGVTWDNGFTSATTQGYTARLASWSGPGFRFVAQCDTLKVWTYGNGQKLKLRIDGTEQTALITVPTSSRWQWVTIATGLDTAAPHLYEIDLVISQATYLYALMTVGGSGLVTSSSPSARKSLAGYGDSIVSASSGGFTDTSPSFTFQLGLLLNFACYNSGIASSQVNGSGATRYTDITAVSPEFDDCFVLYGTNDLGAGRTTSQLQTDYTTMMQALIDHTTATRFYCLGILPRITQTQATIDTYNAAIQAAIAAVSPNTRIQYVDTREWNLAGSAYKSGGTFDSALFVDGLHPNTSGYLIIRDKLRGFIQPLLHRQSSKRRLLRGR